jgi:hypothetical protein
LNFKQRAFAHAHKLVIAAVEVFPHTLREAATVLHPRSRPHGIGHADPRQVVIGVFHFADEIAEIVFLDPVGESGVDGPPERIHAASRNSLLKLLAVTRLHSSM